MANAPKKAPSANDRRLENLKPAWQPGESGNPDGMKPGTIQLRSVLKAKLAESLPGEDRRTLAERLIDSTIEAALAGDSQARKLVFEYCAGRAPQAIDVHMSEQPATEVDVRELSDAELNEQVQEILLDRLRVNAAFRAEAVAILADHRL